MSAFSIKSVLEEMQVKVSEYAVAEAKAKKEKAQVELETARMQQAYFQQLFEKELRGANENKIGGSKS